MGKDQYEEGGWRIDMSKQTWVEQTAVEGGWREVWDGWRSLYGGQSTSLRDWTGVTVLRVGE